MPGRWKALPQHIAASIVALSVRRAWAVLVLAAVLTVAACYYTVGHIAIETDTGKMLDPDLPHRQASRALSAAFPRLPGDVVVYTEAAHAGAAEDAADAVAARLRQRPDIAHTLSQPGGGDFFARFGLLYLSIEDLWDLSDRLAAAEPLMGTLANDPSLRGLFEALGMGLDGALDDSRQVQLASLFERISGTLETAAAGHAEPVYWRDELFPGQAAAGPRRAFVLIEPALTSASFRPAEAAIDALHVLLAELQAEYPQVSFRVTGPQAMDGEELVTVADDAKLTTTLSFLMVAVVLVWGLRSSSLVVAVLITLTCGLIWTAAFATLCVGNLNIISVCFAVLFIGMGVDFGIQFAMRYREEAATATSKAGALEAAAHGVGGALMLAAAGAAISFFAFIPTSYRGLAQLGIISGFSMAVALIANLTLLPALLSLWPRPRRTLPLVAAGATGALAEFVARRQCAILVAAFFAVAGSVVLLPHARFDLNPLNLKDPTSPAVRAFRALAADPESSPYTIALLAASLPDAEQRAVRLRTLPAVDKAITLADFVPQAQDDKLEIIDAMRLASGAVLSSPAGASPSITDEAAAVDRLLAKLATARRAMTNVELQRSAARLAAALENLRASAGWPDSALPAVRTLLLGDLFQALARLRRLLEAERVTAADLPADIKARFIALDGRARIEVFPREDLNDNDAMRRFVHGVQALEPAATGAPIELVAGSSAVIAACIEASVLALLLTVIMHVFVLHGLVEALLVAAPLVLAMLLTVATSVLFGFPFNFANIIALPLLIGLNNAYGAYLVIRKHSAAGMDQLLGSSTPRAVLFSGMTAIASFGTLAVSKHPGMAGMGVLISLSLSYALLCALVVLPAMMAVLEVRQQSN